MVMKNSAMGANLRQSILKSFGRYIAISMIIALGAGLFMGLLMTRTDMVATGQKFTEEQNMFDLRMVSNYGWSKEYPEKFEKLPGVVDAEGLYYTDLIARVSTEADDGVYRFYAMPNKVNTLSLQAGRLPQRDDEILADGYFANEKTIGSTVTISATNEDDALDMLYDQEFTVVGYVSSPLYMDMNRGTTSVGSGSLTNYFYVPEDAFDTDVYTEINLTLDTNYGIYTDEYNAFVEDAMDTLEPQAEKLAEERYRDVKDEIEEEYNEGYQEYLDGLKEYEDGKAEAEQELADAYQELTDAEEELKENRKKLIDAGNDIEDGREQLEIGRGQLIQAEAEMKAAKEAAEPQLAAAKAELDTQYAAVKSAYDQAVAAIAQAQSAYDQAAAVIPVDQLNAENARLQGEIAALQASKEQAESDEEKAAIQAEIDGKNAAVSANNAALAPYHQATAALAQTKQAVQPVLDGMNAINQGYAEIEAQQKKLADAEAQINSAWVEFYANENTLNAAYNKLMVSWGLWHDGEEELAEGWIEYEDAKKEVEEELAEAEKELKDAEEELAEAREEIDDMDEPDLIMLDRTSNVGYNNLDSSSAIVSGVSRVFPVFFLLVASLVCITTMTRMIDEERTQIGTLKALGYSNGEIMSKYLIYSGSGAILGCTLGLALGCTIFPMIIWEAYGIMLYIQPDIVLTVNWPLAIAIVGVYTMLMLLVTWYCCRRTLEEEPAELIRPKAPDPGKKILLEKLPFWNKLSFLNKVTIRNIFRYRQRLAMMLVGIGGCTALLVTGFGLRDSVVNVVDFQFENITHYDLSVYFREALTAEEQKKFLEDIQGRCEESMFYHQSSVELEFDHRVKELYMISADDQLTSFLDLHTGDRTIPLPGVNEVVLSVGVAENMGIRVGDAIILRDADLRELEVTVSGIYDNHIENYCIVSPQTMKSQWGAEPDLQMAFLKTGDNQDVHVLSAYITDMNEVMNVSVSEDLAEMVGGMMEALDLVVVVIVFCAGLLAMTVLYNLTNININERIREIATIKVLGFNASETAAYVFKENMILTVAGAILGLGLGRALLEFVMTQIKIDMVWFQAMTMPVSYGLSIGLTILSAVLVDFIFYFKLDKINMAEALKSVE